MDEEEKNPKRYNTFLNPAGRCLKCDHAIALHPSSLLQHSASSKPASSSIVQPIHSNFSVFWSALHHAEESKIAMVDAPTRPQTCLRLVTEASPLTGKGPFLFGDLKLDAILVTGNSGVGKSTFLIYIMWLLLHGDNPPAIVYERQGNKRLLLRRGQPPVVDLDKIEIALEDENSYYLFDCCHRSGADPGTGFSARTIVFSSPNEENNKEFLRTKQHLMVMPVWSEEEIRAVIKSGILGPSFSEDVYLKRFEYFGGLAREVFNPTAPSTDDKLQAAIITLVRKAPIGDLVDSLNADSASISFSAAVSRVLKFVVRPEGPFDVSAVTMEWLSDRILDAFTSMENDERKKRMIEFLAESADSPEFSGPRALVFERFAHHTLAAGGDFQIRRLPTSPTDPYQSLHLDTMDSVFFHDIGQLGMKTYGIPMKKNFPVVDSVVSESTTRYHLFQATISNKHGINNDQLNALLNSLAERQSTTVDFYFVVPGLNAFRDFAQSAVSVDLKEFTDTVTLRQFVLLLPIRNGNGGSIKSTPISQSAPSPPTPPSIGSQSTKPKRIARELSPEEPTRQQTTRSGKKSRSAPEAESNV